MNMKKIATLILALAALSPLSAEVFTSTYSTTPCEDYELITDMLVGPGVARHPTGARITPTSRVQIGVFSNLVIEASTTDA